MFKPAGKIRNIFHLMPNDFRHNHYVPKWYQKRFMFPGEGTYWYLGLEPEEITKEGHRFRRRDLCNLGATSCFAHDDLYTVQWFGAINTDIEKFFFGKIDTDGRAAVSFWSDFNNARFEDRWLYGLLTYMSTQKLRTPKGLGWLGSIPGLSSQYMRLMQLQSLRDMYCATWTECVWQIAHAKDSATKFIVSDNPVTVYNRGCFPGSKYCAGFNEPDIRHAGTHTYFPLSLDCILILTNLSWVRNPYQSELNVRPNPGLFRNSLFHLLDVQRNRALSEREVIQINYITKQRAQRYIAAANPEWLYPEKHLRSTKWNTFGDGYLFMPEPREVYMGGEVVIGYKNGPSDAFSEYGHKPGDPDFRNDERFRIESASLERFKDEFAYRYGPAYRATSSHFRDKDVDKYVTPDEFHLPHVERHKARIKGKSRSK